MYCTLLGLSNYGNRAIASASHNREKRSRLFCEIYSMQFLCFCVSIVAYICYSCLIARDREASLIMAITVASAAFDINWFFFGMEKFKLTVVRNTIIKIASVVCIFIFVKDDHDVYVYIFIMSLSFLLSQAALWPFLKKYIDFALPKFHSVIRHFKPNLILFVPVVAVSIYRLLDKIFLGTMSSMTEVGYFENAERITTIALTLITAVGTVMLPRMSFLVSSNQVNQSKKYIDKTMVCVLAYSNAAMFGLLAISDEFVSVYYGANFYQTSDVLKILSITIIFLGCGNVVRTQFLIPNKFDKIYLYSAIGGAFINICVNLLLVPHFFSVGAAIGTVFAEIFVCLYQLIRCRNELHLFRFLFFEFCFFVIGFIMYCLIGVSPFFFNPILTLLLHISIGIIFYVPFAFILIFFLFKKIDKISIKK